MLFEITFIMHGYHVYKEIWKVEINSLIYLSQIIMKIMLQWSFYCFKAAGTASRAALVVAEGSASNNGPSGF